MITMEQMLDALHGGCDGLVELRAIPPGNGHPDATFLKPGDVHGLTTFLGDHLREHVYVAVVAARQYDADRRTYLSLRQHHHRKSDFKRRYGMRLSRRSRFVRVRGRRVTARFVGFSGLRFPHGWP